MSFSRRVTVARSSNATRGPHGRDRRSRDPARRRYPDALAANVGRNQLGPTANLAATMIDRVARARAAATARDDEQSRSWIVASSLAGFSVVDRTTRRLVGTCAARVLLRATTSLKG